MPCDTITTQAVVLTKARSDILWAGLVEAGWTITTATKDSVLAYKQGTSVVWTAGKGLQITGAQTGVQAEIVQAYSKAAVSWAAQRAGWHVQSGANQNQLNLTRR